MLNILGTTEEVVNDNVIVVVTMVTDDLVVGGITIMEVVVSVVEVVVVEEERGYLVRNLFHISLCPIPRLIPCIFSHILVYKKKGAFGSIEKLHYHNKWRWPSKY